MSELLAKIARAKNPPKDEDDEDERKSDRARDDGLDKGGSRELKQLQKEARRAKSFLASGGKGGLDPKLAHAVFRRDKYKCKVCGKKGSEDNALTLHHKGGIVSSERESRAGHKNTESNIVTLCEHCHDDLHEEARREGNDSSQVTPEGDKGGKRDKGLPDAQPDK